MPNMSDFMSSQLRDYFFRSSTTPPAKPSVIAIALTHNVPNSTYTGSTSDEISNAGGYVRQAIVPSDDNFSTVIGASGQVYNTNAISFPVATARWGWVSGIIITDSATYGQGNVLAWGALTNPVDLPTAGQYNIPIATLDLIFS